MSAELEFAEAPVHEGAAPPAVKKPRKSRAAVASPEGEAAAPSAPVTRTRKAAAASAPVEAPQAAAPAASPAVSAPAAPALQLGPSTDSDAAPRPRARAKRRIAGAEGESAPPPMAAAFAAAAPAAPVAAAPAPAAPRADAMPQESFTPRERAERQAREDRAAFRAERNAVISGAGDTAPIPTSFSSDAEPAAPRRNESRRFDSRQDARPESRSDSNIAAAGDSYSSDSASFEAGDSAASSNGASQHAGSGEIGPNGQHIPHGMGQSKSSRRRRRKRKSKVGPDGQPIAAVQHNGSAEGMPAPYPVNGTVPQITGQMSGQMTGQPNGQMIGQPNGASASFGMPGRPVPQSNGNQSNGGQNGFNPQQGAAGQLAGTGKRWKKKFRDRDRQGGAFNGAPAGGQANGFQASASQQQFPRDNNSFQPGNTVGGFKRKGQQGGGKQRRDRSFVGPMDHSYRESNGNFADPAASTIEAHGNFQRRGGGGGGRAYQGDSQPIDYSQGRPIPIAEDAPTKIYFFIDDLFFVAKIQETARKMGVKVGFLKNEKESLDPILDLEPEARPGLIVVDLSNANAKPLTLIPKLKAKLKRSTSVVGFLSMLQSDQRAKAVEAGCDTVMARAAFSQNLPNLLRRYGIEEKEDESNFNM